MHSSRLASLDMARCKPTIVDMDRNVVRRHVRLKLESAGVRQDEVAGRASGGESKIQIRPAGMRLCYHVALALVDQQGAPARFHCYVAQHQGDGRSS